jgi:SpoIID/LytB domain protein
MSRTARRLPAVAVGLAVTATLLVSAPPGQAAKTVSERYAIPSSGRIQVTGHGYGHGRGMSQYGAQGAAKQGLNHRQILAHYYPGTTLSTLGGTIRVRITADTDNDVRVVPASGLRVRDVSSGASYVLPTSSRTTTWRLRTVGGATTLDYYDGSWHPHRPGGKALTGDAEFHRSGTLTLRVAGTTRVYRGTLRFSGTDTINVVAIDDYIKGVVAREMPASWMPEALRAQAVAARTYGSWERAANANRHYQTCDTTSCQVYGGVSSEDSRTNAAVEATSNKVLTYGGKPAFTQFGSSSGGWLAAGSMPYLVAKADKYDGFSGNPVHTWTTTVTRAAVERAWTGLGTLRAIVVTRRDGHGDWYGRVEQMTLDGSRKNVTISGADFRSRLGLRSHWFRLGSGTTAPAPAPAPAPTSPTVTKPKPAKVSAITARWKAIGGNRSVVGRPTSKEYSVAGGRARRFQHGRMYSKAGVPARELYGKVLKAYVRRGAAKSRLGFPTTRPVKAKRGVYANFQKGKLFVAKSGRVQVTYKR